MPPAPNWKAILELGSSVTEVRRKQAREIVSGLVDAGHLGREHASAAVDELIAMGRKRTDEISNLVRNEVERQLKALGLHKGTAEPEAPAKKTAAKKAPAKKTAATKKPAAKKAPAKKTAAKKTTATKTTAKKAPAKKTTVKAASTDAGTPTAPATEEKASPDASN